jgi:hypothetical protein
MLADFLHSGPGTGPSAWFEAMVKFAGDRRRSVVRRRRVYSGNN